MKFLKTYIFFFFVFSIANSFSQSLNDYRTTTSGNWTTVGIWERYNGTSWVAASFYPGQTGASANDVTIVGSHSITLGTNLVAGETINSVTIGDRNGSGLGSIETLTITNTAGLNTTNFTIAYDGFVTWSANKGLSFPAGTNFTVEPDHPDESPGGGVELGVNHGLHENVGACSASKAIYIGTNKYTACTGGSSDYNFDDVNDAGGNLTVTPTYTDPACSNQTLNLFAAPGGTEAGTASFTWSVVSFPSPYTNTLTNEENPTDTPTTSGIYVYQVTATSGTSPNIITTTNTVSVDVVICNKKVITNRRITYRVKK